MDLRHISCMRQSLILKDIYKKKISPGDFHQSVIIAVLLGREINEMYTKMYLKDITAHK